MVRENEILSYAKFLGKVFHKFRFNSVSLLECSILGTPNFNMMSENKWFDTFIVFLSLIGVVIR